MAKTRSLLILTIVALGNSRLMRGTNTATAVKEFNALQRSIRAQTIGLMDSVLNRPLRNRQRLELLTSLEEDYVPPTPESNVTLQVLYANAVQMVEKGELIQGGQRSWIRSFRSFAKNVRQAQAALKEGMGVSKVGKTRRTHRGVKPPLAPPEEES